MAFLNIRSVYNKVEEIEVEIQGSQPDILCLAETWLNENKNTNFKIDGYYKGKDNFRTEKVGGCVIILVKGGANI